MSGVIGCRKALTVSLSSVSNTVNEDAFQLVVHNIEDSIISHPKSVTIFSLKLLNTGRSWIGF